MTRAAINNLELPPFDPLNRRAAELRAAGHHVISLGQAVPFFPPPESVLAAARASLDSSTVNTYSTDPRDTAAHRSGAARAGRDCRALRTLRRRGGLVVGR